MAEIIDTQLRPMRRNYRLYPNREQRQFLEQCFGNVRFVYNHFLALDKKLQEEGKKKLTWKEHGSMLTELKHTEGYEWLSDTPDDTLRASLNNLRFAYKNFFEKLEKLNKKGIFGKEAVKEAGPPKFKSRYHEQSISFKQYKSGTNRIESNRLYTLKFNNRNRSGNYGPIKINVHIPFYGDIRTLDILKTKTGKYFASIVLYEPYKPMPATGENKKVGIDVGLKELAVLSDGTRYVNPKFMKKYRKKVKYEQKQLDRKKKGSKSRQRQKLKLSLAHEKVKNARSNYLNTVSKDIVRNNDTIVMESLAVKEMMSTKNGKDKKAIRKGLGDAGLGSFISMIKYKSEWNNRQFKKIDKYFPSSKLCSDCGYKNTTLALSHRTWVCESCGVEHDRDLNAAKNILNEGCKDI